MIETLKAMILDFQEAQLHTGVLRSLKINAVAGKATVCIGVRRSGKSTYLFQIMQRLLDSGVDRSNILYLNFFDDRLFTLQHDGLKHITEAYYSLYPEKKGTETVYCFFDEIQMVQHWESFVDRLMRTEKCAVYITGSSAHMLSTEIATQMRGRALSWELFPFSFKEFLTYKRIDYSASLSTKKRLIVQKTFDHYWESGGFPEVAGLDRHLRVKIHQEYFKALLFRDIIDRHDISHPRAVSELAHWLIDHTASLYSLNNLTGYLKSLGHAVPKSSVADYLRWFEDAYFLFTVRIFDASLNRSNTNPKKIYCIDHALVVSVSSGILVNSGHLLENLVFMTIRHFCNSIFYYKTKNGREIDFVFHNKKRNPVLIQVCESIKDPITKTRELSAITEAMRECKVQSGIMVTRNEQDTIIVEKSTVTVMPIWRFLLEIQNIV